MNSYTRQGLGRFLICKWREFTNGEKKTEPLVQRLCSQIVAEPGNDPVRLALWPPRSTVVLFEGKGRVFAVLSAML